MTDQAVVTENYLDKLRLVAGTSPSYRQQVVKRLYNRGGTIESKNRVLRDIYHLFKGDWLDHPDLNWRFINIDALIEPDDEKHAPGQIKETNWKELLSKIDEAKQQTFPDFETLQKTFTPIDDPQDYLDWFFLYLPYLTLNIPATKDGWTSALKRLEWFLTQIPHDQGCPEELLWDHARLYLSEWYISQNRPTPIPK